MQVLHIGVFLAKITFEILFIWNFAYRKQLSLHENRLHYFVFGM